MVFVFGSKLAQDSRKTRFFGIARELKVSLALKQERKKRERERDAKKVVKRLGFGPFAAKNSCTHRVWDDTRRALIDNLRFCDFFRTCVSFAPFSALTPIVVFSHLSIYLSTFYISSLASVGESARTFVC